MIETQRLRLRELGPGDQGAVHSLLSDERVVRFMLFPLFTSERSQRFIARVTTADAGGEFRQLVLAITDGADGEVIGLCGFELRAGAQEGEAWYLLAPSRWGQGLATEAVAALVDHGFRHLELHRVWATCLPENPASARVLEKLGFRREGHHRQNLRIHGEWRDSYLYAILSSEWQSQR